MTRQTTSDYDTGFISGLTVAAALIRAGVSVDDLAALVGDAAVTQYQRQRRI